MPKRLPCFALLMLACTPAPVVPDASDVDASVPIDAAIDAGPEPERDPLCNDDCLYAADGECDDGGSGALYDVCALGSDCTDCGRRTGETCVPQCEGRNCGADGCGGSCAPGCVTGETCGSAGVCEPSACVPDCTGRSCGVDPVCGVVCGTCEGTDACNADGRCVCVPDCGDRNCGMDPVCGTLDCGTCGDDAPFCNVGMCETSGTCSFGECEGGCRTAPWCKTCSVDAAEPNESFDAPTRAEGALDIAGATLGYYASMEDTPVGSLEDEDWRDVYRVPGCRWGSVQVRLTGSSESGNQVRLAAYTSSDSPRRFLGQIFSDGDTVVHVFDIPPADDDDHDVLIEVLASSVYCVTYDLRTTLLGC